MDKAFDILGMPEKDRQSLVRTARRSSVITGTFDGAISDSHNVDGRTRSRSRSRSRSNSGSARPDSGVSEVQLPLMRASGSKLGGGGGGANRASMEKGIMSKIKTTAAGEKSGFNRLFCRRFARLFRIGFRSPISGMALVAYFNLGLNIGLAFMLAYIQLLVGPTVALIAQQDMPGILDKLLEITAFGVAAAIMTSTIQYTGERIRLDWRGEIVHHMHKKYFAGSQMYFLNSLDRRVDNTDQRLTQDVDNFTVTGGQLLFGNYVTQASIAYVLSSVITATYNVAPKVGAVPLLWITLYAAVCMIVTTLVVIPVVRATFRVNQSRGFFRFTHARIKEYAEAIVFFDGQEREAFAATEQFIVLYWRFRSLFKRQFFVNVWNSFQVSFGPAFATFALFLVLGKVHPTPANRSHHLAEVSSINGLLGVFMGALVSIPGLYSQLGPLAGYTHRLGQMLDGMDELEVVEKHIASTGHAVEDGKEISLDNLTCRTPDGTALFHNFTYTVQPGSSVMVMGASGVGKSSLLRVIGGLWPFDSGRLRRPLTTGHGGCFFLPQRPYITQGTLRQQVVYPLDQGEVGEGADERVKKLLRDVQLEFLYLDSPEGLDRVAVWQDMLSGGEQQRLGFARMLFHSPKYAIMDESTSALDVVLEREVMQKCIDNNITCLSVGHRPTLLHFHNVVMELDGHGSYNIKAAEEEALDPALEALATGTPVPGERESKVCGRSARHVPGHTAAWHDTRASPTLSQSAAVDSDAQRRSQDAARLSVRSAGDIILTKKRTSTEVTPATPTPMFDFPPVVSGNDVKLDRVFLRRFWRLVRSGFPVLCCKPTLMLIASLGITCLSQWINVLVSIESSKIASNLAAADYGAFSQALLVSMVFMGIASVLTAAAAWFGSVISLYWYRALVEDVHAMYFSNKSAYAVNQLAPGLDNVDQRLCADAYQMTTQVGAILFGGTSASLFGVFVQIFLGIYYMAPYGWLPIVAAIAYSILSLSLTSCAMKPVVPWTYKKNHREGDFRQTHSRVREFTESIAFYNGQAKEHVTAEQSWHTLYTTYRQLLWVSLPVYTTSNVFSIMGGFVTFGIYVLQLAFYGFPATFSVQVLFQEVTLLGGLMTGVATLPKYLGTFASVAGLAHRVGQLIDTADVVLKTYDRFDFEERVVDSGVVRLDHLSCTTPDGHPLFKDMTFTIRRHESLLIMGPSGAGKSSLLRVIAGLWPFQEGSLARPRRVGSGGTFFVPQRPYLIENGTLRDQLIYPHSEDDMSMTDAQLVELMRSVDLDFVLARAEDGLDTRSEWGDILSGGEQQRVGFVRLLYHKPVYAIMDESTSALDVPLESRCMQLCLDAGITCISVGHRPTLIPYHNRLLRLDGAGGYTIVDIAEVMQSFRDMAGSGGGAGSGAGAGAAESAVNTAEPPADHMPTLGEVSTPPDSP